MIIKIHKVKTNIIICLIIFLFLNKPSSSQSDGIYPPFTKWYQDPLSIKPLQLSTAIGFAWGSTAVAACLIFTKNDSAIQNQLSIYQEAGIGKGYKPPHTNVFQNEFGIRYQVRKWMTLGLGWNVSHFKDNTNNTWVFGIIPFSRWYPYRGKNIYLYFEYGAGVSYGLNIFPLNGTGLEADTARFGTKFNFTSKYGLGIEVSLNNRLLIQSGLKHFHLSNGNLAGIKRNPSHDSNILFIGMSYSLKNIN